MNINYRDNEYQTALGKLFGAAPKTVCAAVAVSSLTCGGDWLEKAQERFAYEWRALYNAGIVPQKLPAEFNALADAHEKKLFDEVSE
jgi:hypothetical protein